MYSHKNMEDVKTEVETSEATTDSSTETTEEKTVPYSRFREVNEKMRDLETEIQSLKTQKAEDGLTPAQTQELQAKQYLKNLLKETIEEEKKTTEEMERQQQQIFEKEVDRVLSLHSNVKKDDFLKFIEEKGDEYGITSVSGAMKLYKDLQAIKEETSEKTKRSLSSKPSLPKSEGSGGQQYQEFSDKHKSLRQIAEEAIRELSKK